MATADNDTSIATTAFVRAAIAAYADIVPDSWDSIGSVGLFRYLDAVTRVAGYTTAGSNLASASINADLTDTNVDLLPAPAGTWRLIGTHDYPSGQNYQISVWQRIS